MKHQMQPNYLRLQSEKIQTRAIPIVPKSYNPDDHSFECIAATQNRVMVWDWDQWNIVEEILVMAGMRSDSSNDQEPLVDSHLLYSVDYLKGSARQWRTEGDKAICRAFISSTEPDVETKIKEGHLTDVSIGYRVDQSVWLDENTTMNFDGVGTVKGPCKVALVWTRKELSLCIIGADDVAKMRSTRAQQLGLPATASDDEIRKHLTNQTKQNPLTKRKEVEMDEELKKQLAESEKRIKALEEEGRTAATAAEKVRLDAELQKREAEGAKEIMATVAKNQTVPGIHEMGRKALEEKRSSKDFMKEVLEVIGKNPQPASPDAPGARAEITSLAEFFKPWQKRSVRYFNALVLDYKGNKERAAEIRSAMEKEFKDMSEVQRNDELREAAQTILNAPISKLQKARLISSLTGPAGGYNVPTPLLAEIFVLVEAWGVARREFRAVPMIADTLKLVSIATKVVAYWVTQGNNIPQSDLVLSPGTLSIKKLAALAVWTTELDEDQAVPLLPILTELFAESISKQEDLAAFLGDGSATYGGFTGWLNDVGHVLNMDAGKTAFTDATADDWKALRDAVPASYRIGAKWFMAPGQVSTLEGEKDRQGRYIYREPSAGLPATLWGFPIAFTAEPAIPGVTAFDSLVSAAATRFAIFGNPKYRLMGQRRGIEAYISREGIVQASDSSILINALQADAEILRMTERVGFAGVNQTASAAIKTAAA